MNLSEPVFCMSPHGEWYRSSCLATAIMVRAIMRKWAKLPVEDRLIAAFEIGLDHSQAMQMGMEAKVLDHQYGFCM